MKKIKILLVGMSENNGGIENYLINVYRFINKEKFEVFFLGIENQKLCFFNEINNKILYLPDRKKNYYRFIKETKNFFLKNNFDIIHFNLMSYSYFEPIILAYKYSNSSIILHSHTANAKSDSFKNKVLNKIGQLFVNRIKCYYFACSKDAADFMFKKEKNVEIENNGIDLKKFEYNNYFREEIRKKLKIEKDCILIGNVGRLVESKNQIYLIEILDSLIKDNINAKLLLIGQGDYINKLKEACHERRLKDKVIIKQGVFNVNEYLSAMDVFAFPSKFEGLGIVLIEAQANGLMCLINENLPKEAKISNNIIELSINNDSIEEWKNNIKLNSIRKNNMIISNKYDIHNTIKKLENDYFKIYIKLEEEKNEKNRGSNIS